MINNGANTMATREHNKINREALTNMAKEKTLTEQLQDAMASGDMKAVISLAKGISDAEKAEATAKAEANKGKVVELTAVVMASLEKVANDYIDKITELVGFENAGVVFKMVPADKILQCKITTKAVKTGGGGTRVASGLAGVKELLEQHGDTIVGKDYLGGKFEDVSWNFAYESDTDKNFRYAVLKGLRKLAGLV